MIQLQSPDTGYSYSHQIQDTVTVTRYRMQLQSPDTGYSYSHQDTVTGTRYMILIQSPDTGYSYSHQIHDTGTITRHSYSYSYQIQDTVTVTVTRYRIQLLSPDKDTAASVLANVDLTKIWHCSKYRCLVRPCSTSCVGVLDIWTK